MNSLGLTAPYPLSTMLSVMNGASTVPSLYRLSATYLALEPIYVGFDLPDGLLVDNLRA